MAQQVTELTLPEDLTSVTEPTVEGDDNPPKLSSDHPTHGHYSSSSTHTGTHTHTDTNHTR